MKKLLILALAVIGLSSCTENQRAKGFGGNATVDLAPNRKLLMITWKEDELWYLTREMKPVDSAETYQLHEESSWGVLEGTVTINETKK